MTPDLFQELMQHMAQCAGAYRRAAILEARNDILIELFKSCDHASIGIIDRHRVLGLFRAFYDKQAWVVKRHIRNPRRCKFDLNKCHVDSLMAPAPPCGNY